ncbi:hypothetical protein CSPX01_10949 [Colletotrichum filicis]|nr:hypothetical protein CSPX01_10949 [Colletotrichum filicis]
MLLAECRRRQSVNSKSAAKLQGKPVVVCSERCMRNAIKPHVRRSSNTVECTMRYKRVPLAGGFEDWRRDVFTESNSGGEC